MALSGLALSSCVGGPGAYFESVTRENAQNQQNVEQVQQNDTLVASNTVTAIKTNELPPITNETAGPSDGQTNTLNNNLNTEETTANASNLIWPQQTNDGSILLAPQPIAPGTQENAYADSETANLQQNPTENILVNPSDSSGFAIGAPSTPYEDPLEAAAEARIPVLYSQIEHGQCKSGRGPVPKKMSASNIVPGDPYYIELRMRKTPLLPVGHTYVAYGRLSAAGEILDEKLIMLAPIGGYVGATLASGIPMPGILKPHRDDCRIRPETAYRVSLNAQRYEKLLREVAAAKAEKPSYLLFAYNCNHFMTRIAQSVGLKPPKNIYVPALEYIYAMIENNEGRKIKRR